MKELVTKEQLLEKMKIVKLHIDTNDFDYFVEFDKTFDRYDSTSGIKRVPENFGKYLNDPKYENNENLPIIFDSIEEMQSYLVTYLSWLFKEFRIGKDYEFKIWYHKPQIIELYVAYNFNSVSNYHFRWYKFTDAEYIERYFFSISDSTINDILEFLNEGKEVQE